MSAALPKAAGLVVPAHETGVIRVFAPQGNDPALAAVLPPHPVDAGHFAPLLGIDTIIDTDVERINLKDLGDFTFSEFLRIGHDIRSSDIEPIRDDLDLLTGQAFLAHSSAFAGKATNLNPHPALRFIGALRRNDAPPTPLSLPPAEKPDIIPLPPAPASKGHVGIGLLILVVIVGLVVAAKLWSMVG